MDRLKAWCEFVLSKVIDVDTACGILEVAHCHNASQLKRIAFEFIMENYDDVFYHFLLLLLVLKIIIKVSETEAFESMNKECLKEILHVAMGKLRASPTNSPFGSPPKS